MSSYDYCKNFQRNAIVAPPILRYNQRNYVNVISCYSYILYKSLSDSMQQMPRYDYQKNFWKNRIAASPSKVCIHKLCQFFLYVCILCITFCAIPFTISRDMSIKRILEKTELQLPYWNMCTKIIPSFFLIVNIYISCI